MKIVKTAPAAIETKKGLTVAILSCLVQTKDPLTSGELADMITKAGRKTNVQEVSSLLVTIQNSQVNEMLRIERMGRENLYQFKPEYSGATLEQVEKVYLKRIKYTPGTLIQELGKQGPATPAIAGEEVTGSPELVVAGKRVVFILEDPEIEIILRVKR